MTDIMGVSALPTGLLPEVEPVPVSPASAAAIPNADGSNWTRRIVAVWEEWRHGSMRAFKVSFHGSWHLQDGSNVVFSAETLQEVMNHAQAIEARRAATLGAVHESAIRQDAPKETPHAN